MELTLKIKKYSSKEYHFLGPDYSVTDDSVRHLCEFLKLLEDAENDYVMARRKFIKLRIDYFKFFNKPYTKDFGIFEQT